MREKRRYEATYSRLILKLRQEQLATALIVTELQAQTQRVRLPTTIAAATPTSRAAVAVATSMTREKAKTKAFPPLYVPLSAVEPSNKGHIGKPFCEVDLSLEVKIAV